MAEVTIITGSARGDGNTGAVVTALQSGLSEPAKIYDLAKVDLQPFDYVRQDDRDGFREVVAAMAGSEHIVFATPVYWYAMSGLMKTFFDRLTDLVMPKDNRPLGRSLAGRNVWLIATGTDPALPEGFDRPFALTAAYFDMTWRDAFYCRSLGGEALTMESLAPAKELAHRIEVDS